MTARQEALERARLLAQTSGISLATYHKLQRQGRGPEVMALTPLVRRITFAAAREWQQRMSRPEGDEAATQRAARQIAKNLARRAGALSVQSPRHISKVSKGRAEARRAASRASAETKNEGRHDDQRN